MLTHYYAQVVFLNAMFSTFDRILDKHGIRKVEVREKGTLTTNTHYYLHKSYNHYLYHYHHHPF